MESKALVVKINRNALLKAPNIHALRVFALEFGWASFSFTYGTS